MPDRAFYITTAIDYANGDPHMGHALEKIGADAMARYRRLRGEDVRFVIGMDEHGLKVLQSAEAAGISPTKWANGIARHFLEAWERLHISNDDFVRTTEPRHRRAVTAMIERFEAAGDVYQGTYAGYYCVGCEAYKRVEELEPVPGTSPEAEADGAEQARLLRCPIHPSRPLEWMEEQNWFFRLSRYQDRLLNLLDERPEFVQPENRRNEVRNVIAGGLEDISVSRADLPWGIPWPGDPDHTVYVWLDALTNYLSATGFPEEGFERVWPADVHVIGKDITRFHCIYWPAFLLSAGLELPRTVWAHGFLTLEGRKISKSEGVWISLEDAIERHGPEPLRYYLMRDMPWNGDGDFSWDRFDERYTSDLADNLGNLVNRTLSMVERYRDGVVPERADTPLAARVADALVQYRAAMDANLLHQGAGVAIDLARAANEFAQAREPWKAAKDPARAAELDATLAALAHAVACLSSLLSPFLPETMSELATRVGLADPPLLGDLAALDLAGRSVHRGDVLFPKEPT